MMRAKVVTCRGSLSSHEFYALKVRQGREHGLILKLSDRQYSRMLYDRTGDYNSNHSHPEAKKFFDILVAQINTK